MSQETNQTEDLLKQLLDKGMKTRPYDLFEVVAKALSTTATQIRCQFKPQRVIIENPAAGGIIHVSLGAAMDATHYFAIDVGDRLDIPLQSQVISAKSAAGAPTIHVLFLAYEDKKG